MTEAPNLARENSGSPVEDDPLIHAVPPDPRDERDSPRTSWGRSAFEERRKVGFDIESLLGRQPRAVIWVEAFAFIGVVAAVDHLTSSVLSFSIFYLVPVIFTTWFLSRKTGLLAAIVSTGAWVTPDLLKVSGSTALLVWGWNSAVRFAFFLVVLQLVHLMKVARTREAALARTDPLTGVANGRNFADRAEFELASLRRLGHPLTMVYIDLDRFKHINDTLGHTEGDRLLRASARAIASRLRATDLIARLGGDEFGILLPDTDRNAAPAVLAAVREAVHEAVDGSWEAGCTIGAVTFEMAPESVDFMVRTADELMYRGKRAGRDRIEHVVWPTRTERRPLSEAPATC